MARRLVLLGLLALVLPQSAFAYERDAPLEAFASRFAMRPAEVRCPSRPEWAEFTLTQMGVDDPEIVYGVTHLFEDWVMLRQDLCAAARGVTDESIHPSVRALAVLALVHESYHVRRWGWRRDEGQVECRAIQHFIVAARLLGASLELAQRLYWHAVVWHYGIAQPGSAYYRPGCRVP
jgi:hypothetical protein